MLYSTNPPDPDTADAGKWLRGAAALSAAAALLHLAIIAGGERWYRFFGAGEAMAQDAAAGKLAPHLLTLAIAALLLLAAAYALAAAGDLRRLPLMRPALVTITALYLLRGMAVFAVPFMPVDAGTPFLVWSSLICLEFGVVHLVGLVKVWTGL